MRQATARRKLEDLAARRRAMLAERHAITRDLGDVVPAAHAAGLGVSEIARLTGLSRRAVYDLLGKP